jgi:LacI family transcriptional regulator
VARNRTTIRDLAEYTGLSPAAVSYALRGMHVSPETERRVREAAEELGYEADPIARALAGGATGVVGLLVGSLSDFWNQELVRAVQRELYGAALSTLVADADGLPARELELAQRLIDQRVDGLVVVPIGPASGGWASIARQVSTVTIGDALPGVAPAGEVVFDNERGVLQSLQHLSALGHRRVTVLSWAVETSPDREAERAVAGSAASCWTAPTAPARSCACPTRSPTASMPPARSSGCRSPATSPSRASETTPSHGCSPHR